jgi:hypothetical protein
MLLGLGLVGHKLELDGIVTPDLGESDFEVCKSVAPVRASIEIHKFNFACASHV